MPYATYRFNKIIAAETIRFIVTVAIVVYKGLKLVVYRMLTYKTLHHNALITNGRLTDTHALAPVRPLTAHYDTLYNITYFTIASLMHSTI